MISVAAELAGVHPQTLRIYERKELISPAALGRQHEAVLRGRHRAAAADPAPHPGGRASTWPVSTRIMDLQREIEELRAELDAARALAARAERVAVDQARSAHVRTALVHVRGGAVVRRNA